MRLLRWAILLPLLLAACNGGKEALPPIPSPTPVPLSDATATPVPVGTGAPTSKFQLPSAPDRDLIELTQRLRLRSQTPIARVVSSDPIALAIGDTRTFQIIDLDKNEPFEVNVSLKLISDNAYFFVDEALGLPQDDLEGAAEELELSIYPTVTRYFGTEWRPGVDNDPHFYIVHAQIPKVAGYFNSSDEYPKVVNKFSNEVEAIYINARFLRPGTIPYLNTLVHELQHMVHFNLDSTEEVWVNEGLSELSSELAGFRPELVRAFLPNPDIQLNAWDDKPERSAPHYGGSFLFFRYLGFHYGGYENLRKLVEEPLDGIDGINAFLEGLGFQEDFEDVFKDWVIANFLNLEDGGPYSHPAPAFQVRGARTIEDFGALDGQVHQFAADYLEINLKEGSATLEFLGAETVRLLPTTPRSGEHFWWSNRADAIDSQMTGSFDLSGLSSATLRFKTWFDIEKDFDYAYVEASRDGGGTWDILQGRFTSSEDKLGNSFGHAYTGFSGGGSASVWIEESFDLAPYVGGPVLLRFEYVTDGAVNNPGWAIDDISISELGFFDDAESAGGWDLDGFVRSDNQLPQEFIVQVIEMGDKIQVTELPLDANNSGELRVCCFGDTLEKAVLVVSATTPVTTETAPYTVKVIR